MPPRHPRHPFALLVVAFVALSVGLAACSEEASPEVPVGADGEADPVLVQGREIWSSTCSRCHGSAGGGGAGVKLADGRAEELHPEIETMIEVVTEGKGAMPAFGSSLTPEEIEAVVRYVREVL